MKMKLFEIMIFALFWNIITANPQQHLQCGRGCIEGYCTNDNLSCEYLTCTPSGYIRCSGPPQNSKLTSLVCPKENRLHCYDCSQGFIKYETDRKTYVCCPNNCKRCDQNGSCTDGTTKPTTRLTTESTTKSTTRSTTEQTTKSTTKSATEPKIKSTAKFTKTPKPTSNSTRKSIPELTTKFTKKSTTTESTIKFTRSTWGTKITSTILTTNSSETNKTLSAKDREDPTSITWIAVGSTLGFFILVTCISIICYLRKEKRKTNETNSEKIEAAVPSGEELRNSSEIYYNTSNAVPIRLLKKVYLSKTANDNTVFKDEFRALDNSYTAEGEAAQKDENKNKNRFKDIYPYDNTRVVLDDHKGNDYINASFIDGVKESKVYIATQGPTPNTVDDFWRMIWHKHCDKIVMLTKLQEGNKKKCEQYWPDIGSTLTTKNFTIDIQEIKVLRFFVLRMLILKRKGESDQRKVTQFHFTTWPDHGAPDPMQLTLFHRFVHKSGNSKPLVVHCSAGIGRTGTFICVDALYKHGTEFGIIDIANYILSMRQNRMKMVQTLEQYISLHEILVEVFNLQDSSIVRDNFIKELNQRKSNGVLQQEFRSLTKSTKDLDETHFQTSISNHTRNFSKEILAGDKYRVIFSEGLAKNYINAIYIPTTRKKDGFVITQFPLENTIEEFWQMIFILKIKKIIVLSNKQDSRIFEFLPKSKDLYMETQNFNINESSDSFEGKRTMFLSQKSDKNTGSLQIDLHLLNAWEQNLPVFSEYQQIVQVMSYIDSVDEGKTSNNPVLVMSRDGSKLCGIFCLMYNIYTQLALFDEVDIYHEAKELKNRRPTFFYTFEEYESCYQFVKRTIEGSKLYSNV